MTKHIDKALATPNPTPGPVWHALTVDTTLTELKTSSAGLTAQEARRRLDEYGANELEAIRRGWIRSAPGVDRPVHGA
jgi:hypothetical protein